MLYRDERVRMMAAESVPQAPPAQAREIVEVCCLAPYPQGWKTEMKLRTAFTHMPVGSYFS